MSTTTDGPVKLVSLAGSLTINGGSDSVGVSANGAGDVLLEARGATSDVVINADVVSGTGNVTLDADNDLLVNASVSTGGSGTLYMVAGNEIATLVTGLRDNCRWRHPDRSWVRPITQDASITSTDGDVGSDCRRFTKPNIKR